MCWKCCASIAALARGTTPDQARQGEESHRSLAQHAGGDAAGDARGGCRSLAYVHELEAKIDQRLATADLEGAITAARTMLQAVLVELEKWSMKMLLRPSTLASHAAHTM